ncbi:MAG: hypothetical protein AABO58_01030 [Acidobacteriota bacterium]
MLCLALILASACRRPTHVAPAATTVVVVARADVRRATASIQTFVRDWARDATRDPGCVARVVVAGSGRDGALTTFAAEVPRSWPGGDVLAEKRVWQETAWSSLRTAEQRGFAVDAGVRADVVTTDERVTVIPTRNSLAQPWAFRSGTVTHTAVVCDVSPSAESACDSTSLVRAYDAWMVAGAEPASTFEVWRVGRSISDARRIFAIQTPPAGLGDRVAFLFGGRNELAVPALLTANTDEVGSAIAEAMAVAVRSLHDKRGGARSLTVMSDMRQLSAREIDLEQGTVPTPARFADWLASNRLALDLSDVDVTVCGMHNRASAGAGPLSPRRFAELRDLWVATFRSTRVRAITICGTCDVAAFTERRTPVAKGARLNVLEVGAHRGAQALVRAVPDDTGRLIAGWGFVDAKPGRAEEAAAYARERFPSIRSAGALGDGVAAAAAAGKQALVVATMDSVGATIDVIEQRRNDRSLFQLVGRGPGGSATGSRVGVAGAVEDDLGRHEALLFLRGLQSLTARESTSSGALTRGGDPLTATTLGPMRDAAAVQTSRYLSDIASGCVPSDPPLHFFTSGAQYPLAVLRDVDEADSARSARALDTSARFAIPRPGHAVAVAFVNVADRAVRLFFVARSTRDARRVAGITELRMPLRQIVPAAAFTD